MCLKISVCCKSFSIHIGMVSLLNSIRRFLLAVNAFLQYWHWYGFSPEQVLKCDCRLPSCVNPLLQDWHWNGFSPVWTLKCVLRLPLVMNSLQYWHWNGFFPVWTLKCVLRLPVVVNSLLQYWHWYVLTLLKLSVNFISAALSFFLQSANDFVDMYNWTLAD